MVFGMSAPAFDWKTLSKSGGVKKNWKKRRVKKKQIEGLMTGQKKGKEFADEGDKKDLYWQRGCWEMHNGDMHAWGPVQNGTVLVD